MTCPKTSDPTQLTQKFDQNGCFSGLFSRQLFGFSVGLHRILNWLDIRPPDIRPTILPDTGYPAGYLPKNISLVLVKNQVFFTHFFFQFSSVSK